MDARLSAGTFGIIESDGAAREVHVGLPGTEQLGGPLPTKIKTELECILFRPWRKTVETLQKHPELERVEVTFARSVELRQGRGARQRIHHNTEGPHDLWHGRIDFRPNGKCVGRAKEAPEFARSASLPVAHHRTDQPHKFIDGNVGGFAKCES